MKDAESTDFNAVPDFEAVAHGFENRLHDDLRVFNDQVRIAFREALYQLGLRHCGSLLLGLGVNAIRIP
jgi:hypothetical protein